MESANALEAENKELKQKLKEEQERYVRDLQRLRNEERVAREKLRDTIIEENEKMKTFKADVLRELKVKDALIEKLTSRNAKLEVLMKKAVRIMQNPLVMKDAFRKFNFTKYIYSEDGKGGVDVELALSEGSGGDSHRKHRRATVSSSASSQSPQRLATSGMLEDAASERLPARRLNKNLIKVESHSRRLA